jgi:hypothetical protein
MAQPWRLFSKSGCGGTQPTLSAAVGDRQLDASCRNRLMGSNPEQAHLTTDFSRQSMCCPAFVAFRNFDSR